VPENKVVSLEERAKDEQKPFLEQLLREGARKLLQAAIENEVIDISNSTRIDGMRMDSGWWSAMDICRSGSGQWSGPIPFVSHGSAIGTRGAFTSAILPKYMRRAPSVDALLPALYLKGISTGDFSEALTAILGEGASGLSATNIVRLKSSWETDYKEWSSA
jgi:Transposase and inactivated derivatives